MNGLVQKLAGVRDLKKILETTVKELGESFNADACQIMLSSPLDNNVTSICEYRPPGESDDSGRLPTVTLPLMLHGSALGSFSLSRRHDMAQDEVNSIRVVLGELTDVIRHAQINDVVQRDTFRETFLVEIGNVMSYSLGIGDALFMVVNILGKVLQTSRCLFICTDEAQAGWKCYEFWLQDKVESCQDFRWPTTDSPVIAQTLLSRQPLHFYEGQQNSYVSPVQEELQFIGVKSLLGIALRSAQATHGCVILQQCDYRRAWTRGEIDMTQNVADKVAEALLQLPAEKRAREPIMQLHQRIVAPAPDAQAQDAFSKIEGVRRALKGALGQQAIPSARPAPAAPPRKRPGSSTKTLPALEKPAAQSTEAVGGPPTGAATPTISQVKAKGPGPTTAPSEGAASPSAGTKSLGSVLSGANAAASETEMPAALAKETKDKLAAHLDPHSDLEFADAPNLVGSESAPVAEAPADVSTTSGPWGDLDAIAAPANAGRGGLGGAMLGKARASTAPSLFRKERLKAESEATVEKKAEVTVAPLEIDEEAAQKKLNEIMASSDERSDYIFATPGLDMRTLGRIDGWVHEIESKDAFVDGHVMPTAQYAVAIALEAGLSQEQIDVVRQAALVHDVGKLGSPASLLQKPDEQLEDAELLAIMRHPIAGAELLESFADLKHLSSIVLTHREEFDGEGYPQGLKGEEIPIEARIIAVANGYHCLVSTMRYGPGLSPAAAQQKLVDEAGKKYDPAFVQFLLQAIKLNKVP